MTNKNNKLQDKKRETCKEDSDFRFIYLDIAKVFRKVAHKIYRVMLKKSLTPKNSKFLNLV